MGTIKNKSFIIHGWTYSLDKYRKISKLLEEKGIKNTLLKVPGLTDAISKVWSLDDYVRWLKSIIDKEKNKIILIGHSNGGRIALSFSNKYPEKIERLILIDSAGILHKDFYSKSKLIFFKTLSKIGNKLMPSAILKNLLYKAIGEKDYNNANPIMKKTMNNLIKTDLEPILHKITAPTLIIWGKNDQITPLNDAKIMHSLIKNSKLHIIKNARHSPHFTHAEEVAKIIYESF